jgi:hypothetical protein
LNKEIPESERRHASGCLLLGTNNSFEMALLHSHFDPNLSSEHVIRARIAVCTAADLARTWNTPLKTFNTTTIETRYESSRSGENACSRFAVFTMAVSGDTFFTWQKN